MTFLALLAHISGALKIPGQGERKTNGGQGATALPGAMTVSQAPWGAGLACPRSTVGAPFLCLFSPLPPASDSQSPHPNSRTGQNSDLEARPYLSLASKFPIFHDTWGAEKPPESFGPALSSRQEVVYSP